MNFTPVASAVATLARAAYHAVLGPSSAYRWRKCSASVHASRGISDDGNDASRMGTACHGVVAECLQHGLQPVDFLGRTFLFAKHLDGKRYEDFAERVPTDWTGMKVEHELVITDDHVRYCESYVDFIREQHALLGGELLVEQRVAIGHITGESYWVDANGNAVDEGTPGAVRKSAGGTSDIILLAPPLIAVFDAKFGRNRVTAYEVVKPALPHPITGEMEAPVYAPNDQLALYAGGALHEHRLFSDFTTVKMVIVQPPLDHVSEFTMSVDALDDHLKLVKVDAEATRTNRKFFAGEHCEYCPARISCTARDEAVGKIALEGFVDMGAADQVAQARPRQYAGNLIGSLLEMLPMVRSWCDDIATRAFNTLNTGGEVIGANGEPYKLVQGRQGPRKWVDIEQAEAVLKKMRLRHEEMYDYSIISPTSADKLAHPKARRGQDAPEALIGKNQWIKLERLITRSDPSVSIAPASDSRPAYQSAISGFDDATNSPTPIDPVDLF